MDKKMVIMKDLTIEEKAKRYDEAINRIKHYVVDEHGCSRIKVADVFPEFEELDDEKIRQFLIHEVTETTDEIMSYRNMNKKEVLDWLEKQGEQKPTDKIHLGKEYKCIASPRYSTFMRGKIYKPEDKFLCSLMNFCSDCFEPIEDSEQSDFTSNANKVEPKFKVGDWITDGNITIQIEAIKNNCYLFCVDCALYSIKTADKVYHLWTIKDAKPGDVLVCNEELLLFKSYSSVQGRISLYCWYNGHTNNFHSKEVADILMTTRNRICPATKEQRNMLFSKMKEAGYKWDSEKKQLITVFKPKFRIGDTIKKKSTGDIVTISVVDLKNREYRLSNTGFIPFKYEHLWELVEIKQDKHDITIGTKIRSKANPDVILTIISDDCHEDEFECSNGSVLSLKQIEKYYERIK